MQLLTNSRMQAFKTCRRKHFYAYEMGLRRETDARALRIGSAVHEALDRWKRVQPMEVVMGAVDDFYAEPPDAVDEDEWWIEHQTTAGLVSGYDWRWQGHAFDVIASEQSFDLPLENPATGAVTSSFRLAGKIDGVVQVDGRLLVLEHKTVSESIEQDSDYWRLLQLDPQISLYVWAARRLGHDVSGVLYDVIRKPTIQPTRVPLTDADDMPIVLDAAGKRVYTAAGKPRKTGDAAKGYTLQTRPMTPSEWQKKLLADIGQRPTYYYARQEIARLDDDVAEHMVEVWELQKTIRDAQRHDRWYKTAGRNTCPYCPYFGLCTSRYQPNGETPEGFVKLEDVHPELEL